MLAVYSFTCLPSACFRLEEGCFLFLPVSAAPGISAGLSSMRDILSAYLVSDRGIPVRTPSLANRRRRSSWKSPGAPPSSPRGESPDGAPFPWIAFRVLFPRSELPPVTERLLQRQVGVSLFRDVLQCHDIQVASGKFQGAGRNEPVEVGRRGREVEGGYRTVTSEHFQSGLGGGEAPSGLPGHLHQPF